MAKRCLIFYSLAIVSIVLSMVTIEPVYGLTNSSIVCIDNNTLQENITVYVNGNMSNLSLSSYCPTKCDNITMACNPPTYQQNLVGFVIFIVFIIAMYFVLRRL